MEFERRQLCAMEQELRVKQAGALQGTAPAWPATLVM
jgi:hypothetical protein